MDKIIGFFDRIKKEFIVLSMWFDSQPDLFKRLVYHFIALVFANLALVITGKESVEAFLSVFVGDLASYMTWIGKNAGVKAGETK